MNEQQYFEQFSGEQMASHALTALELDRNRLEAAKRLIRWYIERGNIKFANMLLYGSHLAPDEIIYIKRFDE